MAVQSLQAGRAEAVTPSDTVDINEAGSTTQKTRGALLYVGVAGDLRVLTSDNNDIVFKNVPVGFFPVHVRRVFATNTAASEIIALW